MHGTYRHRVIELPIGGVYATGEYLRIRTLLGSCVASCLYDPDMRVGGMNHILLPGYAQAGDEGLATRYGVHAMELLINRIMCLGGAKPNLRAKVFGGAKMLALTPQVIDVADMNTKFVLEFLERERIPIEAYSLGGTAGMTVLFEPVTGKALIRRICGPRGRELASREQNRGAEIYRAAPRVSKHNITLFEDL